MISLISTLLVCGSLTCGRGMLSKCDHLSPPTENLLKNHLSNNDDDDDNNNNNNNIIIIIRLYFCIFSTSSCLWPTCGSSAFKVSLNDYIKFKTLNCGVQLQREPHLPTRICNRLADMNQATNYCRPKNYVHSV